MATWWGAAECFHYVMCHQPASCIFWCPDEDRAVKCITYCKTLYAQMDPCLKELYPLKKPLNQQAVYSFQFADGGLLDALPGKNPDKIRSEHPALVFMDECCFNEQGDAAYDNAVSTRPTKLVAVSSAAPSWFEELTKCAVPIAMDEPLKGVSVRQIPAGKPAEGTKVVRLHYRADPSLTPEKISSLKSQYTSEARWNQEMEIDYGALGGSLVFSGFDESIHLVDPFIPPHQVEEGISDELTIYMSLDPHTRTAHGALWLGVDREGNKVVLCSWWPNEENESRKQNGKFGMTIKDDYAPRIKEVERDFNLTPYLRYMDPAGHAMNQDEQHDFFAGYLDEDIYFRSAKKNRGYAGYDLITADLKPQDYVLGNETGKKPKLTILRGIGDNDELAYQLRTLRYREFKGNVTDKDAPEEPEQKRRHLVDCLSYILLEKPTFVSPRRRRTEYEPTIKSCAY